MQQNIQQKSKKSYYAYLQIALLAIVLPFVAFGIIAMVMRMHDGFYILMRTQIVELPNYNAILAAVLTPFGLVLSATVLLSFIAILLMIKASIKHKKQNDGRQSGCNLPSVRHESQIVLNAKEEAALARSCQLECIGQEILPVPQRVLPPAKNDFGFEFGEKNKRPSLVREFDPLPSSIGSLRMQKKLESQLAGVSDFSYNDGFNYTPNSEFSYENLALNVGGYGLESGYSFGEIA